ncbi:unnamed protein product [Rangifer tarandus platyrhynchus]|uniref:Uncharacterized protein n=1 Tax=Rangifer tarandus platyrhynchus TaxID=3082113 RepID=A0AC59ZC82_RANTA
MDRFLGFVKQIRRSRRRKGKKYRPEEDYHEGYEDVYYYASEHFRSESCGVKLLRAVLSDPFSSLDEVLSGKSEKEGGQECSLELLKTGHLY